MSTRELEEMIESVRNKQENIAVGIGVFFTLTLCTYFFTYARLVDALNSAGLWFMGITSIAMLVMLFKLKPVSMAVTRLLFGKRAVYKDAFAAIAAEESSSN